MTTLANSPIRAFCGAVASVMLAGLMTCDGDGGIIPRLPPQAATSIIWDAGMETGDLSDWALPAADDGGGEFNSDGGDAVASQNIAHTGTWSARMALTDGSGGTRLFRWREAREYPEAYYSAWFYFPDRYEPEAWWNIFQFKSKVSDSINDAFWVLNVGNRADGAMYLYLYDWQNEKSYGQQVIDLPVGQWVHLECYLRQSAEETGQLTCWQDGVTLWDLAGISTKYPAGDNQWSINNYASAVSPTPVVIYVDDAAIRIRAETPGG